MVNSSAIIVTPAIPTAAVGTAATRPAATTRAVHREDNRKDDDKGDDLNGKPNNDCYVAAKSHVATLFSTGVIARFVVILCLQKHKHA